jgi:hypothetical protein
LRVKGQTGLTADAAQNHHPVVIKGDYGPDLAGMSPRLAGYANPAMRPMISERANQPNG